MGTSDEDPVTATTDVGNDASTTLDAVADGRLSGFLLALEGGAAKLVDRAPDDETA